jgi:hypothetical protein
VYGDEKADKVNASVECMFCSSLLSSDCSIGRVYRLVLVLLPALDDLEQVLAIRCPGIRCSSRTRWQSLRLLIHHYRMSLKRLLWYLLALPRLPRLYSFICLCSSILPRPTLSGLCARKDNQLFYARSIHTGFVCSRGELADCGFGDAGFCFDVAVGGFEDEEHY